MKYLRKYKLFESNSVVDDIKDIFLDLTDDEVVSKVDVEQSSLGRYISNDNDIHVVLHFNNEQTISSFFNSDTFKRAYNLLNREGFTIYYIYITVSGEQIINNSSLSFDNPEPWIQFSKNDEIPSKITFEFHKPKDTLHVIWTNGKDEDDEEFEWDGVAFDKTREECTEIIKDMSRNGHYGCRTITDRKFWSLEPR